MAENDEVMEVEAIKKIIVTLERGREWWEESFQGIVNQLPLFSLNLYLLSCPLQLFVTSRWENQAFKNLHIREEKISKYLLIVILPDKRRRVRDESNVYEWIGRCHSWEHLLPEPLVPQILYPSDCSLSIFAIIRSYWNSMGNFWPFSRSGVGLRNMSFEQQGNGQEAVCDFLLVSLSPSSIISELLSLKLYTFWFPATFSFSKPHNQHQLLLSKC